MSNRGWWGNACAHDFDFHGVMCKGLFGNIRVWLCGDFCHDGVVVTEGCIGGPFHGRGAAGDFAGTADVVGSAAAQCFVVWVIRGDVVLLARHVLTMLGDPLQNNLPSRRDCCLQLCVEGLVPVCAYDAWVVSQMWAVVLPCMEELLRLLKGGVMW